MIGKSSGHWCRFHLTESENTDNSDDVRQSKKWQSPDPSSSDSGAEDVRGVEDEAVDMASSCLGEFPPDLELCFI